MRRITDECFGRIAKAIGIETPLEITAAAENDDETSAEILTRLVGKHVAKMRIALEESVKLQSHYASLLNMHDGGTRVQFENGDAWIARLRETGKIRS